MKTEFSALFCGRVGSGHETRYTLVSGRNIFATRLATLQYYRFISATPEEFTVSFPDDFSLWQNEKSGLRS